MTMEQYKADEGRYQSMRYRYCGNSGLQLPVISLGLWHNSEVWIPVRIIVK